MSVKDPYGLSPIWDGCIEVYLEFARVCDKHHLRYYVTDGNALGAVRHNGFIPWDDDFDVSMPRPDYERFVELANTELPPHLKFVDWHNAKSFNRLFGKIQDTRVERIAEIEAKIGHMLSNGNFIDIFPIDGYPDSIWQRFKLRFIMFFLNPLSRFRLSQFRIQSTKGKIVWIVGAILSVLIPFWRSRSALLSKLESELRRYSYGRSKMTGRACSRVSVIYRPSVPKSAWGDGQMMEFYGIEIPLPSDYDAYLTSEYGDYKTLPPAEKQHPTHWYDYRAPWWLGPDSVVCE